MKDKISVVFVAIIMLLSVNTFFTTAEKTEAGHIYIITFNGPIQDNWKETLKDQGVIIHEYRQLYKLIVEMDPSIKNTIQSFDYIKSIDTINRNQKYSSQKFDTNTFSKINIYTTGISDALLTSIESLGGQIIEKREQRITVLVASNAIPIIADNPNVLSINNADVEYRLCNADATWILQTNSYGDRSVTSHGITGAGEILTVMDSELRTSHEMFADPEGDAIGNNHRKIQSMQAYGGGDLGGGNYHGTHVTGTVLGDAPYGSTYETYNLEDGHAIGARLIFQDIDDTADFWGAVYPPSDLQPPMQDSYNAGSRLQTNSWGGGNGYTDDALEIDTFTWNHKDYNVLFAMGNSGSSSNTISIQPEAKNAISVGGVVNYNNQNDMFGSSSRGYADDGRIKPTVLGVAQYVTSADNSGDTNYNDLTGTSMATPAIAGQVGQIRQYFNDGWYPTGAANAADGFNPSAALVKAILVNGADEITGSGAYQNDNRYPNGDQGWGRSNLENGLYFDGDTKKLQIYDSWNEGYDLSTGGTYQTTFSVSDTTEPVEVTLVWTDYVGPDAASSSNPALVNDLDLEITTPSGTNYVGNAFTGYNPGYSQANPTSNPWNGLRTGKYDGLNVVENILLIPGYNVIESGTYSVTVSGHNIPQGPQPFALVITGGLGSPHTPPTITVTVPNGGESWNAGTTQDITWTTSPGDGAITGVDLEYSTDGGSTYNPIVTSTTDDGSYSWTVPDEHSAQCYVRATVHDDLGSSANDISDAAFEIIGIPPSSPSGLTVEHAGTTSVIDTANSAIVNHGSATNDYTFTQNQDDTYHQISEVRVGGPANRPKGSLEVVYSVTISDGNSPYTLFLDAYRSDNEAYDISYQINSAGYSSLGQLTTGTDTDTYNSWTLSGVSAGDIVDIRFIDTQEDLGETMGTLFVDHLYIESSGSGSSTDDNKLTWNASPDDSGGDVVTYTIYRSSSDTGPWDTIYDQVTADGSSTYSYYDSGAGTADSTIWWYVVRAVDSDNLNDGNANSVQEPSQTNTPPNAPTNPSPVDGAMDVSTNPTLTVDVSDPDGNTLDVSFYDASDDSLIGTDTNVASGGTASVVWSGLSYVTTYNWYTVANDGINTTLSNTWSFTTMEETVNTQPDAPTNPSPADGATGVQLSPTISVYVNDADGDTMTVSFYQQGGTLIGSDTVTGSGTASVVFTNADQYSTTYYWYAVADDGFDTTTSNTWWFTTEQEPQVGGMYVWDISWSAAGPHLKSLVTIKVDSDNDGIAESSDNVVSGATVYYTLTNQDTTDTQSYTDTTDSNGQVEVMWKQAPTGTYEGFVTNVVHSSYTYNLALDEDNPDYYTH